MKTPGIEAEELMSAGRLVCDGRGSRRVIKIGSDHVCLRCGGICMARLLGDEGITMIWLFAKGSFCRVTFGSESVPRARSGCQWNSGNRLVCLSWAGNSFELGWPPWAADRPASGIDDPSDCPKWRGPWAGDVKTYKSPAIIGRTRYFRLPKLFAMSTILPGIVCQGGVLIP